MHVLITSQQRKCKIDKTAISRLTGFFLQKAAMRTGISWGEVSVVLVNDKQSCELNMAHLGHDYATDVISFNFEPIPGDSATEISGEIILNVELARRLGPKYKGSEHELALYLAHGCDHLSGADDNTPRRRKLMRKRELRWLAAAKRVGLCDIIIGQAGKRRKSPAPVKHPLS